MSFAQVTEEVSMNDNLETNISGGIDSPRKQMAKGIAAEDVTCKTGFTLMIRISGDAACVTPSTAEKLQMAGWGIIEKIFTEEPEIPEEKEGKDHSVELSESIGLKGN